MQQPEQQMDEADVAFPGTPVLISIADCAAGNYRRGVVVAATDDNVIVQFSDAHEEPVPREMVWPANEPENRFVDDVSNLVHISSATLVENVRLGFAQGSIYTWVGGVLVAVNPMRPLPEAYSEEMMRTCRSVAAGGVRPAHPFAQAELAMRELVRFSRPASFVVSGESGAGKTETTRQLLRYLLWRADGGGGGGAAPLSDTLLEVSAVVELFGSAATLHNANSSRVGRFLLLDFAVSSGAKPSATVHGARLATYLLERSRVVAVAPGERGFHVFYGLLSSRLATTIGLGAIGTSPAAYGYLRPGKGSISGRDDAADFAGVVAALERVGMDAGGVAAVGQLLASVLVLGNLQFEQDDNAVSSFVPGSATDAALAQLAQWLGADVRDALLRRQLQAGGFLGGAPVHQNLDAAAAVRARDAVARALYSRLFAHLVERVNAVLSTAASGVAGSTGSARPAIGLLDIFGFECFETNSLEQLLINFANEKLHAHFLTCLFDTERSAYAAEGVPWPEVSIPTNADLLRLLEEPPLGLLPLLDDQCTLPTPMDTAFRTASIEAHARSALLTKPKHRRRRGGKRVDDPERDKGAEFILRHFAGAIRYSANGFVEKNTDRVPSDALTALQASHEPLIKELFSGADADGPAPGGRRGKKGPATVASAFTSSLRDLLRELGATKSYFVRCVRPTGGVHAANVTPPSSGAADGGAKLPMHGGVVLAQLEALGVLEAVELMTRGYPTRIPYASIHETYANALPPWAAKLPPKELVQAIATAAGVDARHVQYGVNSLFCRAGKASFLERLLGSGGDGGALDDAAMAPALLELLEQFEKRQQALPVIEKNLRMWVHRRRFLAEREIRRAVESRKQHQKKRYAAVTALARRRQRLNRWQGAARTATIAATVTGAWATSTAVSGEAAAARRAEEDAAASKIQRAFVKRKERAALAAGAAPLKRQSTVLRRFRAAAHASIAFTPARPPPAEPSRASRMHGYFEGDVSHAGHLRLEPAAGAHKSAPRGECYCVLLSCRTLLTFEVGGGSFDPESGEAVDTIPIALDDHAEVRIANRNDARGRPSAFHLKSGATSWLATPALFADDDRGAVARAVATWVRRLSAALVPEGRRATRSTLARATAVAVDPDEDDDDDDDEQATGSAAKAPDGPVHMAGTWANGCFYRGDGSVAYYEDRCADDPYA